MIVKGLIIQVTFTYIITKGPVALFGQDILCPGHFLYNGKAACLLHFFQKKGGFFAESKQTQVGNIMIGLGIMHLCLCLHKQDIKETTFYSGFGHMFF